ncbi:MAG: hypothetical protein FD141_87 [Fusobacteria bacterium]|nr:MAG: hypothetical protein FD141_87 [Fusobacteriota bacterium]KAF0229249.1 MAG: hypothetical protein FD182_1505 [Fusobacteriota bacterium]
MKIYPKILVVSHNCFSKHGSNGRTLGNLFINWPKESLAQFYINNELPNSEVCNNYFRITDIEVLNSYYKRKNIGTHITDLIKETDNEDSVNNSKKFNELYRKSRKKTNFKYIVRNLLWNMNKWRKKEFQIWVEKFNPDLILLQIGDYSFMHRIALDLSKLRGIPIILYNSEDYYFKDKKSLSPLYHLFRFGYKRQFENVINYSSHSIYNSKMLQDTYLKKFDHESSVIMTSTEIEPSPDKKKNESITFSYLGNLGVGRHEPLIEIANTLHEIDSNLFLDLYGSVPDGIIGKLLSECDSIRLKGFVSYEQVKKVLMESDVLVHAENFSEYYQWDLKHAFSTKIADYLASGTCFLCYAPSNFASTKYLLDNKVAFVVTEKKHLKKILQELLECENNRQIFSGAALEISKFNHNIIKNSWKFEKIILQSIN